MRLGWDLTLGLVIIISIISTFLWVTPAQAVTITDLGLNCAGAAVGGIITNVSCLGQGLFLDARVTGWPANGDPLDAAPVGRFALTVDEALIGEEIRTLPTQLGPCFLCSDPPFFTGLGMGWRLPLDALCAEGCVGDGLASLDFVGGRDPSIAFTLDVPTPEPTTLLLFGTTVAGLGVSAWRRRCWA